MKLAITGAAGFLGQEIIRQAGELPQISQLHLTDRVAIPDCLKSRQFIGDLCDPTLRAEFLYGVDVVIHLASILGGAAEADPVTARKINVDLSLSLIEELKPMQARLVFASSIAVLGPKMPDPVTDDTATNPSMRYGMHKEIIEKAISFEARHHGFDAVSLRPSGIVARDGLDKALKSAFISQLFWAIRRGEDITLPVGAQDTTWLASVENTAQNFLHAALTNHPLPKAAITLPALSPSFGALASALQAHFPESCSKITYAPQPDLVQLFGSFPKLDCQSALASGFVADGSLTHLIHGAMPESDTL